MNKVLSYIATLLFIANTAVAEPFIPTNDQQVLAKLPISLLTPTTDLRQWREQLSNNPNNLPLALKIARHYFTLADDTLDARYYGYAQATLQPWWTLAPPPPEVQMLRAVLRQKRHDFEGALSDLSYLLDAQPSYPEALLTRAFILRAQGYYTEALRDCQQLRTTTISIALKMICISSVLSVQGQAEKAYQLLEHSLAEIAQDNHLRQWLLTEMAVIAYRTGKMAEAENHFQAALSIDKLDAYLFNAYSDFLLSQNRPEQVLQLLDDLPAPNDTLLLKTALASKASGLTEQANNLTQMLRKQFALAKSQDEHVHYREEARLALVLDDDTQAALTAAEINWQTQKEPEDARIFLQAALAHQAKAAAQPVINWISQHRWEDVKLRHLINAVEEI